MPRYFPLQSSSLQPSPASLPCTSQQKQLTLALPLEHPASLDCQEGMAEMDNRDVTVLQDPQGHQDVMEEMEQQDVMVLQDPQDRLGHQ